MFNMLFARIYVLAWTIILLVATETRINDCTLYIQKYGGECIPCEVKKTTRDVFEEQFKDHSSCQAQIDAVSEGVVKVQSYKVKFLLVSLDSGGRNTIHTTDEILFKLEYRNKTRTAYVVKYFVVDLKLAGSHPDNLKDMRIPLPLDDGIDLSDTIKVISHSKWACDNLYSEFEVTASNPISVLSFEPDNRNNCSYNVISKVAEIDIDGPRLRFPESQRTHEQNEPENDRSIPFINYNPSALEAIENSVSSDSGSESRTVWLQLKQHSIWILALVGVLLVCGLVAFLLYKRFAEEPNDAYSNSMRNDSDVERSEKSERLPGNLEPVMMIKPMNPRTISTLDEVLSLNTGSSEHNNTFPDWSPGLEEEFREEGDNLSIENLEVEADSLHPEPRFSESLV